MNVENILAIYAQRTAEENAYGLEWYGIAHTFALGLAEEFDTDIDTAAGVLAAISPRLRWDLNMAYARRLFETGDAPLLGLSKGKALRLLGGDTPEEVLAAPKGKPNSGQKVRAFFDNIRHTDRSEKVCIDRHAFDIAAGQEGDDHTRKMLERNGVYEDIAGLYREAAHVAGILPHQMQAITWVVWRRLKGITD